MADYYLNSDGRVLTTKSKKNKKQYSNNYESVESKPTSKISRAKQTVKVDVNDDSSDIRTVKTSDISKKKKKYDALEKTGATIGNTAAIAGEAITKNLEGKLDWANIQGDKINNWISNKIESAMYGKKKADKINEKRNQETAEFVKQNLTDDLAKKTGVRKWQNKNEAASVIKRDNVGGEFVSGVANMIPDILITRKLGLNMPTKSLEGLKGAALVKTIGANAVKSNIGQLPGTLSLAMSAHGGATEQALNQGHSLKTSDKYGLSNALNEAVTEMMFEGIPGTNGVGAFDSLAERGINKGLKGYGKAAAKTLLRAYEEGMEEKASTYLDALARQNILGEKVNWKDVEKDSNRAMAMGAAIGGTLNIPRTMSDIQIARNENLANKLTAVQSFNPTEKAALSDITQRIKAGEEINAQDMATINYLNSKANQIQQVAPIQQQTVEQTLSPEEQAQQEYDQFREQTQKTQLKPSTQQEVLEALRTNEQTQQLTPAQQELQQELLQEQQAQQQLEEQQRENLPQTEQQLLDDIKNNKITSEDKIAEAVRAFNLAQQEDTGTGLKGAMADVDVTIPGLEGVRSQNQNAQNNAIVNEMKLIDEVQNNEKLENNSNMEYNETERIRRAIEEDPSKKSYAKYNHSADFMELPIREMKKAIALGSKPALEAQQLGLNEFAFNDDNYIYTADISDKNSNKFAIKSVEPIKNISEEVFNERQARRNSGLANGQGLNERANYNGNQSIGNRTTSQPTNELATNQSVQELATSKNQSIGNIEQQGTSTNESTINQRYGESQSTNDAGRSGEGDGSLRVLKENKNYEQIKETIDNLKATHKRGAFFDTYSVDDLKTFKTFQTPDGKSSISVKPDGDITALVSEGNKGMGTDLLMKARENGGTKMDCYGTFLKDLYEAHGFEAVARVHYGRGFNEQMDAYVDNAIREGKAKSDSDFDIYFMMKNNDSIDTVKQNIGKYEHKDINTLPYMEYDEAYDYRDGLLAKQGENASTEKAISTQDNQGRTLSKQQQDYFKDSKVRDGNGNLLEVYHGGENTHTEFKPEFFNTKEKTGDYVGQGFYFSKNKGSASKYGSKVQSVYLDIKNPLVINTEADAKAYRESFDGLYKPTTSEDIKMQSEMKKDGMNDYDYFELMKTDPQVIREEVQRRGYDGLIDNLYNQYAVFNSNQIKAVDNTNPTTSADITDSFGNNIAETKSEPVVKVETTGKAGEEYYKSLGANDEVAKVYSEMPKTEKQSLSERIKTGKASLSEEWQYYKRNFVDQGDTIYKLGKKTKNPQLYAKYDMLGRTLAQANNNIGEAQSNLNGDSYNNFIDKNGNKTNMSLNQIWEGIDPSIANEYLAHYRNVDTYNQVNENGRKLLEQLQPKIEDGSMTIDEANEMLRNNEGTKYVFSPKVTDQDSLKVIKQLESEHPELKRFGKNIWQYGYNQLQNMVDGGLISQQQADQYMKDNEHYVRIQRDVQKPTKGVLEFDKNGKVKVNKQIQEMKGSTSNILPFQNTMAKYSIDVAKAIRMNQFGQELFNTVNMGSTDNAITSLDEGFGVNPEILKANEDGTYSLTVFKDGVATVVPINEGIYEALTPNKHYKFEETLPFKGIRKFDNFRKALITSKNPYFLLRNGIRDAADAPFNSKHPALWAKNYPKAMKDIITNSGSDWQQFKALGGLQDTYFDYKGFVKQGSKLNPLTWFEKGNNAVEQFPRYAEFLATKEAGGSIEEAMYNAAEVTTNFKRGGNVAKTINKNGGTFFNPSIQGFDKLVRNFTDVIDTSGTMPKVNTRAASQLLAKAIILGIGPGLLNDAMWDDDDEYKEMQDYQKDNYFLFKGKNGKWIRIPKGRAMSIFQSAARRTKYFLKGDKDAYKGLGGLVINQVAPNNPLENNVISPLIDVARNKSWSGNPIVNQSMEKRPKAEQYNEKTDEFSKWLGKKLNVSPMKVNYLIDQYSGVIGDLTLPTITPRSSSDTKNPLVAGFKSQYSFDAANSSKSVGNFYDTKDELEIKKNSVNAKPIDRAKSSYMTSQNMKLSELYNKQKEIQNNPKLSKKQKYDKALEVQKEINKFSKQAVDNVNNAEKTEYYVKIGDYYYKKVRENGRDTYRRDTSKKIPTEKYALYDYFRDKYYKSKGR